MGGCTNVSKQRQDIQMLKRRNKLVESKKPHTVLKLLCIWYVEKRFIASNYRRSRKVHSVSFRSKPYSVSFDGKITGIEIHKIGSHMVPSLAVYSSDLGYCVTKCKWLFASLALLRRAKRARKACITCMHDVVVDDHSKIYTQYSKKAFLCSG